jgi:hypothetical protein
MTSPLDDLPLVGQLHLLLLRASGRVPDDTMVELRWALAEGRNEDCAARLAAAGLSGQFPMSAGEIAVLGSCAPPGTALPEPAAEPVDTPPATPFIPIPPATLAEYGDSPLPPLLDSTGDPAGTDGYDQAVLDTLDLGETIGVWRSWRIDIDADGNASAARIYVIESNLGVGDLPIVAAGAQQALIDGGDDVSQVEVYRPYLPLPAYQWAARSGAALIWASYPAPEIRIAVVPEPDSYVDPEEPRLSGAELDLALDYLRSAAALMTVAPVPGQDDPPTTLFTDGWWVWSDALTGHLERHGVVADPLLLEHLQTTEYTLGEVDAVAAHRALVAVRGAGAGAEIGEITDELPVVG